jgi:hypothetical protein
MGSAISDGVVRIGVLGDYASCHDLGGPGSVTAANEKVSVISGDKAFRPEGAGGCKISH